MKPASFTFAFLLLSLANAGACTGIDHGVRDPSRSAAFDGRQVHYRDEGRGQNALVFVHGWSCDSSVWSKQMAAFEDWRRIAIDLPGHGQSDKPELTYTLDYFARSIAAVLDDAHVSRAVLIGHSNGTPVIRQFYRRYPERVRGLVVVDGALRSFFGNPAEAQQFIEPMRAPDYRETVARAFIDPMLAPMKSSADRARVRATMLSTPQHVMVSSFEAVIDPAIWNDDPIRVPVLAVMAKAPFWNEDYKAYVRKLVPGIEWIELEGVSHFLMLDAPASFNSSVRTFLRRIGFRS